MQKYTHSPTHTQTHFHTATNKLILKQSTKFSLSFFCCWLLYLICIFRQPVSAHKDITVSIEERYKLHNQPFLSEKMCFWRPFLAFNKGNDTLHSRDCITQTFASILSLHSVAKNRSETVRFTSQFWQRQSSVFVVWFFFVTQKDLRFVFTWRIVSISFFTIE